jgi:hypothetical protein
LAKNKNILTETLDAFRRVKFIFNKRFGNSITNANEKLLYMKDCIEHEVYTNKNMQILMTTLNEIEIKKFISVLIYN